MARLVISSIADDRYALSDDQLDDLKLAVSEACVVAIESGAADSVAIECDAADIGIVVSVEGPGADFGASSDLSGLDPLDVESGSASQNLGMPLIGTLVDTVEVEAVDGANRLKMTVHCELSEEL